MRSFLLIPFLLLVSACMEIKDKKNEQPAPVTSEVPTAPEAPIAPKVLEDSKPAVPSPVKYQIIGFQPHKYMVALKADSTETTLIKKTKSKLGAITQVLIPLQNLSDGMWTDKELQENSEIEYQLGTYENSKFTSLRSLKFVVPEDLELVSSALLSQLGGDIEVTGIIFVSRSVLLQTGGKNIHLKAKQIIFWDNVVETFPANQKAHLGQNGRSGGDILLEAEIISGSAHFNLRGEGGGDGVNGSAPSGRGSKGKAGKNAVLSEDFNPPYNFTPIFKCITDYEDGLEGGSGTKGNPGGAGADGGASGALTIKSEEHSNFSLSFERHPGSPGYGGPGSAGQAGGLGGDAGELPISIYTGKRVTEDQLTQKCSRVAHPGPDGAAGPYGDRGPDGQAGKDQEICFLIQNQRQCE